MTFDFDVHASSFFAPFVGSSSFFCCDGWFYVYHSQGIVAERLVLPFVSRYPRRVWKNPSTQIASFHMSLVRLFLILVSFPGCEIHEWRYLFLSLLLSLLLYLNIRSISFCRVILMIQGNIFQKKKGWFFSKHRAKTWSHCRIFLKYLLAKTY